MWTTQICTQGEINISKSTKLWRQTQINVDQWNNLLQATGGALKPEKCFWYSIDYNCEEGIWTFTTESEHDITITNLNGDRNTIHQKEVSSEMKTLGVYDSPAGGNKGHLDYIKKKASTRTNRMKNGHLPSNIAWVAYKLQLWAGL